MYWPNLTTNKTLKNKLQYKCLLKKQGNKKTDKH